ncbi:DUF1629 domain-containing protein [Roseibium sp. HPY-6]|uniref:imm11 family protein n=1 Tax=Roseibium sp. HPY-6 TaxID=3229852 RepID=UPI00338F7225
MTKNYEGVPSIEIDEYWNDQWGSIVETLLEPIDKGLNVDAKYFPLGGYLREKMPIIPDLFSIQYWFCTSVIREAIERLEPSRHKFHPFTLRDVENKKTVKELFIINILDPIDLLDVSNSQNLDVYTDLAGKRGVALNPAYLSMEKREISLRDDGTQKRHLWLGPGAYGPGKAFVSDELHEVILQHDIEPSPLKFYRTKRNLH